MRKLKLKGIKEGLLQNESEITTKLQQLELETKDTDYQYIGGFPQKDPINEEVEACFNLLGLLENGLIFVIGVIYFIYYRTQKDKGNNAIQAFYLAYMGIDSCLKIIASMCKKEKAVATWGELICGLVGLVYAKFVRNLALATNENYDGCKTCGTAATRPEWFEFSAVLIHSILDLICACNATDSSFEPESLLCYSALEGVVEFLIGLIGFWARWPWCDCVFPVLMGIMGLDKLVDTLYELDALSTHGPYIGGEIIVIGCCVATVVSLFLQLIFGGCPKNSKSFDPDYNSSVSMEVLALLVMLIVTFIQLHANKHYRKKKYGK